MPSWIAVPLMSVISVTGPGAGSVFSPSGPCFSQATAQKRAVAAKNLNKTLVIFMVFYLVDTILPTYVLLEVRILLPDKVKVSLRDWVNIHYILPSEVIVEHEVVTAVSWLY